MLEGRDVIGQALTGIGKTAAFGLPIMNTSILEHDVQALVLTPTRELCIQVTQALRTYGAQARNRCRRRLRWRTDPKPAGAAAGRRASRRDRRPRARPDLAHSLMLHACRFVVLDEADEMLDLGFLEDVEKILSLTPRVARRRCSRRPCRRRSASWPTATCTSRWHRGQGGDTDDRHRRPVPAARRDEGEGGEARRGAERRAARPGDRLRAHEDPLRPAVPHPAGPRMNVRALHGDMSQGSRDGVMLAFKGGRVPFLVATDVAARGLDISTVTHVINYDVPTIPGLRAPDRAHRPGRALGPRDHLRRGPPAARAGGDRAPHRDVDRRLGAGRQERADAGRGAPAPALQAGREAAGRKEHRREVGARRRPRRRMRVADIVGAVTRRPASTARPSAT